MTAQAHQRNVLDVTKFGPSPILLPGDTAWNEEYKGAAARDSHDNSLCTTPYEW
jgi:hypothetical protein